MPSESEPSTESSRNSPASREERLNRNLDAAREAIAAEDAYRTKLRRRRERQQQTSQKEPPPTSPEE